MNASTHGRHAHPHQGELPACPATIAADASGQHAFLGDHHGDNSRRMLTVVALTLATMVIEIGVGYWSGSMALLADGWHMASHAVALGASAFAYRYAQRHVNDRRYSFGTGKVGDLAAFASSLLLVGVAAMMVIESVQRLTQPTPIAYAEALAVAVLGLVVNLASALLLRGDDAHAHGHAHHDHDHDHDFDHDGHGHAHDQVSAGDEHRTDHNLRSAYVHVLADALTSVLAIAALFAGLYLGWTWTDPVVGIVGAVVIAQWAWGLGRRTAAILLDASVDTRLLAQVRHELEHQDVQIADLHLWRLAPGKFSLIVSLTAATPLAPSAYKSRLADIPGLAHITVEVEQAA